MRLGQSNRALANAGVVSRNKAKEIRNIALMQGWLDTSTELPEDSILLSHFEKTKGSSTTSFASQYANDINKWIEQSIQATTIYQYLKTKYAFTGSYNSVQRYVKNIKSITNARAPTTILDFLPGVAAQVDFGLGPKLTDVETGETFKTWIFVMVLCWSRHQYIELVIDQTVETWLGCHRRAFEFFCGVPEKIIIDNPKCAITKACYYNPEVQRAYAEYAEGYPRVSGKLSPLNSTNSI
jgi:transposase